MKLLFLAIVSTVFLNGCLSEDRIKLPNTSYTPQLMNDDWVISTPFAERIDSAKLSEAYKLFYSENDFLQVLSLTVIRNGKLISEGYCRSESDRTRPNAIWSCTKSFTSMVTGLAFAEGKLGSVNDSIGIYLPTYTAKYPDKGSITIHDLLTMQGGIDYNNDGISGQTDKLSRQLPDDCIDFILGRPLKDPPGTSYWYNDGLPTVMSAILQKQLGKTMADYADEKIFAPLNIKNYRWDKYKDGVTFGAYGLWMTPRDLAKIGWMVCDSGRWNGKVIIPFDWLQTSTSVQVLSNWNPYGYYWWINKNFDCFYMSGHGGQEVFIVPSKKLVVVITSEPFTQDQFQLDIEKADQLLILIEESCK